METIVQELILLLSRCLCNYTSDKNGYRYSKFHFKGYYLGQKIIGIEAAQPSELDFDSGEDYLLWIKAISIEKGILNAVVIKAKKIA